MGVGKRFALGLAILLTLALPAAAHAGVAPNPVGQIDCNGFSPIQRPVKPTAVCADPRGRRAGGSRTTATTSATTSRRCGSSRRAGSGSDITWIERLPREPAGCRP